jgi:hypothetical protein
MRIHYEDRFRDKEMHTSVLWHMREAYTHIASPGEDAHAKLIQVGRSHQDAVRS